MNTRTYILSSTTLSAGEDGFDVYESGPTNFVISFSGINSLAANSTQYLKFLVEYPDTSKILIVQNTVDFQLVKNEKISRIFYPTQLDNTTYQIDVSGIRADFVVDLYRINLIIGKNTVTSYKDFKIINSHMFSNSEGVNQLMLTVECDQPRYITNVLVPYDKNTFVYLPGIPPRYIPSDNIVLRTEARTYISIDYPVAGLLPIISERKSGDKQVVKESQFLQLVMSTEFQTDVSEQHHNNNGMLGIDNEDQNGYPKTVFGAPLDINGISPYSGNTGEDEVIIAPEDGIDYIPDLVPDLLPESSNKTYTGIYPDGILQ